MYIIFKTKTPASVFILGSSSVEFPEQDQAISYWNYNMHVSIEKSGETFITPNATAGTPKELHSCLNFWKTFSRLQGILKLYFHTETKSF